MNDDTSEKTQSRRQFLARLTLGLGGLAAAIISVPVIAAVLAPFLKKSTQSWRDVGEAGEFETGTTNLVKFEDSGPDAWAGTTAHTAAWLRKNGENDFIAFSVNCTHMGCPVRWEQGAQLFMCPCHGGVYYKDGSRASGPPPKGLQKYEVRVLNGQVQILTAPIPITTLRNA